MLHQVPPPSLRLAAAPPIDPRRRLELEVWIGHIDRVLAAPTELMPGMAAQRFLARLTACDAAQLRQPQGSTWTLLLLGVTARADASAYALLRNWQAAAMRRIEGDQA